MFSWPVRSYFAIIHVDIWMPSKYTDSEGNMALMNDIYDMSQFVFVVSITNEASAILVGFYFQFVVLKFGICHLVVTYDSTPFNGPFVAMCTTLDLDYDILINCNDKGSTIEHFHGFLNKVVTISMEYRLSHDVPVPAEIVAGYSWNSAPIDGTDMLRSIVAIGSVFRFPIDIHLSALPQLT